ncbi:hypothetical protein [Heyndrickxia acidicola]|uniref:Uncharacterized protein n=1 Tax=Heyndrickxia acidicola TaxID=209389 RepID=A0ABU6MBQ8_9BACI|nr:hypothetical protein [Heyndrickxia acidicola]MED1201704.1 hypothetical protein [Heyndrickxia acidicola]
MKKELLLGLTAFFFMSLGSVALTHAVEKPSSGFITLHTYHEDVTGDGKQDKIILYASPYEEGSQYFKRIWADILTSHHKKIRLQFAAGYQPEIRFKDLNHDGVKDLLESSNTGGSGGIYSYSLSTVKDHKPLSLPLPPQLNIEGRFTKGFNARIDIPTVQNSVLLKLQNRKSEYIRLGIYQENGTLNEQTELMIDPVSILKPVRIPGKQGYGLIAYRQVSGAYHADRLGTVKSTWYWEKGKWNLLNAKWVTK